MEQADSSEDIFGKLPLEVALAASLRLFAGGAWNDKDMNRLTKSLEETL
jgi:hypothetical protein